MDRIIFDVKLPALGSEPNDVESVELTVSVEGEEPQVKVVAVDTSFVTGFSGPENSTVRVEARNVDNAGNKSDPSVLEAVLLDTFPPSKPGDLAIVPIKEEHGE